MSTKICPYCKQERETKSFVVQSNYARRIEVKCRECRAKLRMSTAERKRISSIKLNDFGGFKKTVKTDKVQLDSKTNNAESEGRTWQDTVSLAKNEQYTKI